MRIYLVGGAVRDALLGRHCHDKDFLVTGTTQEEFIRHFPQAHPVGKSFPVFLVEGQEFSFPRNTGQDSEERPSQTKSDQTESNKTSNERRLVQKDLLARDLTINALAVPLPDYPDTPAIPDRHQIQANLIAHPQALADLHTKTLRPASPTALEADPLRIVRAARLQAELPDFSPHPDLIHAMHKAASSAEFAELYPERVASEIRKGLRADRPGNLLRLLNTTHSLHPWLTELAAADSIPAGPVPWHDCSVLEHIARVMDTVALQNKQEKKECAARHTTQPNKQPPHKESPQKELPQKELPDRELTCWMALTHDLGKTITAPEKYPAHHGHDKQGISPAATLGERLALPARFIRAGQYAAALHMKAGQYPQLRPGTRVDLLTSLHKADLVAELFALVHADHGRQYLDNALQDLQALLSVHLPEKWRNRGAQSGEQLRQMQAQALSRYPC